nr:ATP-binding cassette domain-containing protein [Halosolutus gelatinilyticus]
MDPASVTVENCSLSFDDLRVLEELSLTVEPGEFVGVVGPNGAGKTTLLRTISGAIEPDAGAVTIGGVDVHEVSSKASSRLVAVVPQDTTLSFSFPVRDVVEMGRHPHRSRFSSPAPADRAAVERALERTRTTTLADRPIDEISGGQRQRVVLARAIAQETPVLVLDEPTASLDVNHQIETLELIRELVADGRTAIAAIHDLDLAARYCDRLALLSDSTISRVGRPSSVLTRDALADSFDANAVVTPNPITGAETVTALATGRVASSLPDRAHVLGSGAVAAAVLARLEAAGVETSLGPVSRGDAAAETARSLGATALTVDPFAPLSAADRTDAERLIEIADVTICTALEDQTGNVLDRVDGSVPLVVVKTGPFSERNDARDGSRAKRPRDALRERATETTPEAVLDAVADAAANGSQSSIEADDD